jgi:hypothetical protein
MPVFHGLLSSAEFFDPTGFTPPDGRKPQRFRLYEGFLRVSVRQCLGGGRV